MGVNVAALVLMVGVGACSAGGGANGAPDAELGTAVADSAHRDSTAPAVVAGADSTVAPAGAAPRRDDAEQPQYRPGTDPWEAARARGANFRGIGQEPGWTVEVIPERSIVALLDYGERTITAPWSAPRRGAGGRVTFTSPTAAGELVVDVTPVACSDAMSGEAMTHTVVLRYGASEYRGCGRVLGRGW